MVYDNLNEQQLQAVKTVGSPLLVLAGAGSGKTRVLTAKTAFLIDDLGVNPERIALLTFTNKAASEMKERVAKIGSSSIKLGFAGTFHTLGARVLRRYGNSIGIPSNFVIYDTSDQESLVKKIIKDLTWEPKSNRPGMYLNLISRLKNEMTDLKDFEESVKDEFGTKLAKVWRAYENELNKAAAVDFDDLLGKVLLLPHIPIFDYVLVDEYQDTNKAQYKITKRLAGEGRGLTVVGDAAQAIYSFRGADHRNITLLNEDYGDLITIELPRNYRSSQMILDGAYGVIKRNTSHPVVKLIADREAGERIKVIELGDEREESWFVADRAVEARTKNETLAVLYRTNAQSRAIEESLVKMGIPYRLYGGVRFYDRAEIKDVVAYLRVVLNKLDLVSWARIEGLGKRQAAKYREFLDENRERLNNKLPNLVLEEILNETKYQEKYNPKIEEDMSRLENIKELLTVSQEYETIADLLTNASLMQSTDDQGGNVGSRLLLMTIHSAKGLEFENVIVVGLEEGILPHSRSLLEQKELEEERRLMYVAMTRAKNRLFLTVSRTRMVYGGRVSGVPSRFLADIPANTVEFLGKERDHRERNDEKPTGRRIVSDWEVEKETADDFAEIDAW